MRILQIHNFYSTKGGEDVFFTSLVELLRKRGDRVFAWTKESKKIKDEFLPQLKLASEMFWSKKTERELSSVIDDFKPDVAHFHNIYPLITATAYSVCQRFKVPIVQTVHNYRFVCPKGTLFREGEICQLCVKKRFYYPSFVFKCYHKSHLASLALSTSFLYHYTAKTFDLIDKFVFPSAFTRQYYLKYLNLPLNRTEILPNFVEVKEKETREKKDYFLFVGRLSEEKGILRLLDLFSRLPKLNLVVVGDGPLKSEVDKYKNFGNILIKGKISEKKVHELMKEALAVVFPSLSFEVMPMVLVESFACATPVIVPKFGAFESLIKGERTGFFYQSGDMEDLKSVLVGALAKKGVLLRMGEKAKDKYERKYTADKHYRQLLKIYQSVAK